MVKSTMNTFKTITIVIFCFAFLFMLWNGNRLMSEDATKQESEERSMVKAVDDGHVVAKDTALNTADDKKAATRGATVNTVDHKKAATRGPTVNTVDAKKVAAKDVKTNVADPERATAMDKLALFMVEKTRNSTTATAKTDKEKKLKAEEYIKAHANPPQKHDVSPTIKPFPLDTSTHTLLKNVKEEVREKEIEEALRTEKKRRLKLGDDDLLKIPGVKEEIERNLTRIPNIVHFVWFSCHRFQVHDLTSMMSALVIQKASLIMVHTNCPPEGEYWDEFVKQAGSRLKIAKRSPPTEVWGKPAKVIEHLADIARLQILLEVGGIYMDCDFVILKSMDPLRQYPMVMGKSISSALGNSMMLANRNSWFLKRWYQEYRYFQDSKWSESSCHLPWSIAKGFPSTIHVMETEFLRPTWQEVDYIYQQLFDWSNNYAIHLYSRSMQKSDGTSDRSLLDLAILNTTYGEISRHVLWGDKRPRDISFLM